MNRSESKWNTSVFTAIAFLSLFIIGFVDNLKGPTMPELLREMDFAYSQGGTIILASYFGYFASTLLAGVLVDISGRKTVISAAGGAILAGGAGAVTFEHFWGLALSFFVIGLGLGGFDLGGNSIIVDLQPKEKGRFLSLISVMRGIGATISPAVAGIFIAGSWGWRAGYLTGLAVAGLIATFTLLVRYPVREKSSQEGLVLKELGRQILMPEMRWLYILMFAYIGLENSVASWLPAYLQEAHGFSVQASSRAISLFSGCLMVGRLAGSFIIQRAGYLRVLLAAACCGLACLVGGLLGGSGMTILLSISGLFFSLIFPVTTAVTTDMHQKNVGSILGLLFSFAGLGGAFGPWLIGLVIDWTGMRAGFGLVIPYTILVLASVLMVRRGNPASTTSA